MTCPLQDQPPHHSHLQRSLILYSYLERCCDDYITYDPQAYIRSTTREKFIPCQRDHLGNSEQRIVIKRVKTIMLRTRDIVAAIMALVLTRMAWNENMESITANANLAFYLSRDGATTAAPFDVDGDGTTEALAVIKTTDKGNWVLQILDLKPLHQFGKTHLAPFRPSVLFESQGIGNSQEKPLELTTGQVLVQMGQVKPPKRSALSSDHHEYDDRTRHYFCGLDWHDAASKCGTPCPDGQGTNCPGDERCFADTPCDALATKKHLEETQVLFQLTPGGGLPSIVSVWDNGSIVMHSLTNEKSAQDAGAESGSSQDKKSKPKRRRDQHQKLQLREMWNKKFLPDRYEIKDIEWDEMKIEFLDALVSEEGSAEHGMVVLGGSFYFSENEDDWHRFMVALDAFTGKILWQSFGEDDNDTAAALPLPMHRTSTSLARRRTRVVGLEKQVRSKEYSDSLPSCLTTFKHVLKDVFPYSYWSNQDMEIVAMHMDQKTREHTKKTDEHHPVDRHYAHKTQSHDKIKNSIPKSKKWHHKLQKKKKVPQGPTFGRPNVLVSHGWGSLQIRSLKNGRPLCHLSLLDEVLYSDFNADGIVDQVKILTESSTIDVNDKWVSKLTAKLNIAKEAKKPTKERLFPSMCHALGLSGLPPKEEIFSVDLCGRNHDRNALHPKQGLDYVSPIIVESLNGRPGSRDIVTALNNGMVHRLHGTSGRKEWELIGSHHDDFPIWIVGSRAALLTRVQTNRVAPSIRPILMIGENSMAVISTKNGGVLSLASFPQTSMYRPILAELSGDGTTDVVVFSSDAIWGFQIAVNPGAAVALRIMVGLLLVAIMLAVLRNRFGQSKDKRSTDE